MDLIFDLDYTLTTNDFDRYDRINPCAILDICQDIAGRHATKMGIGFLDCFPKGMIWILARTKYEVINNPSPEEIIKVVTYPKKPSLIDMDRDFEVLSSDNKTCYLKVTQKWVLFDYKAWKMLPTSTLDIKGDYIDKSLFEGKFRPLIKFNLENKVYSFKVKPSQIDHNMHMNNTKYAEEILNALRLKEEEKIKTFEINYLKQSMLDDNLDVFTQADDKNIKIEIVNNGEVACRAMITLF